jgi:hypothetical protein
MQLFKSCAPRQLSKRSKIAIPIAIGVVAVAGLLSPLFDLSHVHGFPGAHLYAQHLYFDGIADAGGYYAATFCKHWYHRLPIAIAFALGATFLLVTLVG